MNIDHKTSEPKNGRFLKCFHNCGKFYSKKSNLDKHLSTHAGVKPFRCDQCSENFNSLNEKKKHLKKFHSDKEIFKCDCGKEFEFKSGLKIHQRVHVN